MRNICKNLLQPYFGVNGPSFRMFMQSSLQLLVSCYHPLRRIEYYQYADILIYPRFNFVFCKGNCQWMVMLPYIEICDRKVEGHEMIQIYISYSKVVPITASHFISSSVFGFSHLHIISSHSNYTWIEYA
ncbi:hypothetical protein LOAG_02810 [Loa loa]|uniref:Uncharacterized protein n=1 Tax=Loa loa TaxID=7209 RepID=A0A1S0U5T3_LOALO|nr:hypothetical protein LOAG_02810 [Loa loa]EFO25671.1 hypothetical protein LOAG_02810 [Loa loa]